MIEPRVGRVCVFMRDTRTNETRVIVWPQWHEGDNFMWSDGNYACDCNRHLLFERVSNPDYDGDFPCNSDRNVYVIDRLEIDGYVVEDQWNDN